MIGHANDQTATGNSRAPEITGRHQVPRRDAWVWTTAVVSIDLDEVVARRAHVLEAITSTARRDRRVGALLVVGSLAAGTGDTYSDIDLVVIPEPGSVESLLADRLAWPAQFGEVLLQLDSSWNVWSGASQVLTLLDGELPLWVDMDIWPPPLPGIPRDARVLAGAAPQQVDLVLSELATLLKERHGQGQVGSDNPDGVGDVARVAWRLKGVARGYGLSLDEALQLLEQPWPAELERARDPLRRYADHVRALDSST